MTMAQPGVVGWRWRREKEVEPFERWNRSELLDGRIGLDENEEGGLQHNSLVLSTRN